jgi:hypothetical protein
MKTLVLVSIPGAVLGLDLADFPAGAPVEGRTYEFDGNLYKVVEVIETLGSRTLMGVKVSGDARLLSFAEVVAGNDAAMKMRVIKPKLVGVNAPEDVRSAGGIIIAQTKKEEKPSLGELNAEPMHIIFVKTSPADSVHLGNLLPGGFRPQSFVAHLGDDDRDTVDEPMAVDFHEPVALLIQLPEFLLQR